MSNDGDDREGKLADRASIARSSADLTQLKSADPPLWLAWVLLIGAVAFLVWFVVANLERHKWVVPTEDRLVYVTGTFSRIKGQLKRPYTFLSETGGPLKLACYPESSMNNCLAEDGLGLDAIAGKHTRLGYFDTPASDPLIDNLYSSSRKILMVIKVDGQGEILYPESAARLRRWSSQEDANHRIMLPIGALIAFFFIGIAIVMLVFRTQKS